MLHDSLVVTMRKTVYVRTMTRFLLFTAALAILAPSRAADWKVTELPEAVRAALKLPLFYRNT